MSIFREIPPTAGFPFYGKDFAALFSGSSYQNSLEEDFTHYLGAPYAQVTYSGTAAFYLILESLKELSPKQTVIIPSFICPLVPLAIYRAGLKVEVCDIAEDNFNFNAQQLRELCAHNNDILAIVAVHLGGIPIDVDAVKQAAEPHHIFIIEDCAQSLGAVYKGRKTGTLGEFAFYSLCRGKGLTIYEGGVLVTAKEEYGALVKRITKRTVGDDFLSESLKILELCGYWLFYRPQLFWWVFRLPQLFWNWQGQSLKAFSEYYTVDFPLHKVSKIRKTLGHVVFPRLEQEIVAQRQKVVEYRQGLEDVSGIQLITEAPNTRATYPYLTLLFDDPKKREKTFRLLGESGRGVSQVYLSAITDYAYLKDVVGSTIHPHARSLAEREITLSTSTYVKKQDINFVVETIKKVV